MEENCHQVIYKKDTKSPKKFNELSADDFNSFKIDDGHATKANHTTLIPKENTNCVSNSELIKTDTSQESSQKKQDDFNSFKSDDRHATKVNHTTSSVQKENTKCASSNELIKTDTSQESSQIKQDEYKYMVNLLHTNNFDIANLQSQDEKLISKIPPQTDLGISKIETIMQKNVDNEIDLTQSDTEELEDAIDNTTVKVNINQPKNDTFSIDQGQDVESSISIQCPESPKTNLNSELSQDQDPEIISFRAMCEIMLENKPTIDNDGIIRKEVVNNLVLGYKQINENVMSVDFMGCVPSTSKFNSVYDLTNTKNVDNVSKPLAHKRQVCSCKSSSDSDESSFEFSNGSSQKRHAKRIKRPNYSLSRSKLKIHPKSRLNKPSNTVYLISTSSEDEEDCVLIESKSLKDQIKTKIIKEIKPIFTCSPKGQIHKDMLNFMNTNNS